MKQFWILGLVALLASCGNHDEPDMNEENEMVEITFNVSSLDIEVQPMSRASVPASEKLTTIHYYLKNKATQKVFSGTQNITSNSNNFGVIKLWVSAGSYDVAFFGYGNDKANGTANMYADKDGALWALLKDKDSFIYKQEGMTIAKTDESFDINLSRLNGALVVRLTDELPSDVGKIGVSFGYYPIWDVFGERAVYESSDGFLTPFSDFLTIKNNSVEEYTCYVLPQSARTVTLTVYDSNGGELGATSINVQFYRNKKTIIQGNILDVITQKPFNITVTDDWDDDVIYPVN